MIALSDSVFGKANFYALTIFSCFSISTSLQAGTSESKKRIAPRDQQNMLASVSFDEDMLRKRGIDPKVAEYFAQAPRFREGVHPVTLFVNGVKKGQLNASFDSDGELVFDIDLLEKAGLKIIKKSFAYSLLGEKDNSKIVYRFLDVYPNTVVTLKPGKEEVYLVVPTDALRSLEVNSDSFNSGGTAAIFNYNLLGLNSSFSSGSSKYRSADTVVGFNAGDWIVRSRQTYTIQNDKSRVEHLYTYGQKTFTELKSIVQGGEINIANSLFAGDAITGVQIVPEAGLRGDPQASGAVVEGIANSTSRVEVRQNNALIHTSVVPAGPFTLTGLRLLSSNSDLDVTVIEDNGSRQTFSISAASLGGGTLGAAPGYSFAAGRYRPYGGIESKKPTLLTGTGTWKLDKDTNASAGLMGATGYQAAGWAADRALTPTTRLGVRQLVSNARDDNVKGTQISATLDSSLTDKITLGLSATQQTTGYRDLVDTTYLAQEQGRQNFDDDYFQDYNDKRYSGRYRNQYTVSAGWSDKTLGGFRLSHSYSSNFDDEKTQRLIGSWSKNFKHANVSVNVQKTLGETGRFGGRDSAYVSVSFPIGGRTVKTYVNADSDRTRMGVTLNEKISDNIGYRLQTEKDLTNNQTDFSVMTNVLPRYAQTTLGYSRSGADTTTINGSLSGGIVAHGEGVTFSPYAIDDTFSVLTVGDVSGVKISTPQGPVWTDYRGKAVAPSLRPYSNNRLEISAKSLPRNVDIVNGFKEVQAGRGSVSSIDFGVVSSRRVLLTAKTVDGKLLEKGLAVLDGKKQYLSTVVNNGQIFLPNIEPGIRLSVELANGTSCVLDYTLPGKADSTSYFESIDAVCNSSRLNTRAGV